MAQLWDITPSLSGSTPTYPGDTPFGFHWTQEVKNRALANVSTITLSPHVGAHVDAPLHLSDRGHDVSQYPIETFLGPCIVIDVTDDLPNKIPVGAMLGTEYLTDEAKEAMRSGISRVLFKTRKTRCTEWTDAYCALTPELVQTFVFRDIKLVGIDTPSIDPANCEKFYYAPNKLYAHWIAFNGGMAILENLDLSAVSAGIYELIAMPLPLRGVEASPVRAVLRKL